MRKLRAWNSIKKEWLFVGYKLPDIICSITADEISVCEVTEHTGLYIDDKPVYCGDILENTIGLRGNIIFIEGSFMWKYKNKTGKNLMSHIDKGFLKNKKMIGNIYENPELINNKK